MDPDELDRLTQEGKRVMGLAQEEAQRFNHHYIGTEHILLGLVRDEGSLACETLRQLGAELSKVRNAIEFIIGRGDRAPIGEIGLTPRARRVVALAIDESQRLGHATVGPEHLLLGLIREGEGIAAGVLASLGIQLDRARQQLLWAMGVLTDVAPVQEPSVPSPEEQGPVQPWRMAGRDRPMRSDRFDKFAQRSRQVLALAQEEAQRFNHNFIGPEHLLLGLVREGEGVAAIVLAKAGVHVQPLRDAIVGLQPPADRAPMNEIGLTAQARKVIEDAVDESRRLRHHYIGTEHLLLGLLRQESGVAIAALQQLGVDLTSLRQQTITVLSQSQSGQVAASAGPTSPATPAPPLLDHLQRVIGLGQSKPHGPIEITALSLEAYDEGFRLLLQAKAAPGTPPFPTPYGLPLARAVTASDDAGTRYRIARYGSRPEDGAWRFDLVFTPALTPAARTLQLEAPPAQGPAATPPPSGVGPALAGAWSFTITLPS